MKNKVKNINYSLLSQEEIDILVKFLMDKKSSLDSSVMNQKSIDRLIQMLLDDSDHIQRVVFDPMAHVDATLLDSLNFRKDCGQECELCVDIDSQSRQLVLTLHNAATGKDMQITPDTIAENDGANWGYSISPSLFIRLAGALCVKCSRETYESVCLIFARNVLGDEKARIPSFYLSDNESLLEVLL